MVQYTHTKQRELPSVPATASLHLTANKQAAFLWKETPYGPPKAKPPSQGATLPAVLFARSRVHAALPAGTEAPASLKAAQSLVLLPLLRSVRSQQPGDIRAILNPC